MSKSNDWGFRIGDFGLAVNLMTWIIAGTTKMSEEFLRYLLKAVTVIIEQIWNKNFG
jgi:hypothetical protein